MSDGTGNNLYKYYYFYTVDENDDVDDDDDDIPDIPVYGSDWEWAIPMAMVVCLVVACGVGVNDVRWYEHINDTLWIQHDIDQSLGGAYYVCAANIDNDNDIDVIATAIDDDIVVWYENTLPDTSWTKHTLGANLEGAGDMCVGDIDNDNDVDVVVCGYGADVLICYQNPTWTPDTIDANIHLGFKDDERDYGVGAQILRNIGVTNMRLMTNNPVKRVGLQAYGLEIDEIVPIEIEPNKYNQKYMKTKRDRMGHHLQRFNYDDE